VEDADPWILNEAQDGRRLPPRAIVHDQHLEIHVALPQSTSERQGEKSSPAPSGHHDAYDRHALALSLVSPAPPVAMSRSTGSHQWNTSDPLVQPRDGIGQPGAEDIVISAGVHTELRLSSAGA
jgi:hypothetical protein